MLYDRVKESREEIGMGIAQKTGATVVPPYDHPWILTGQGTAGLELAEQAKALGVTLDAVAAPCSGGGLSTGGRVNLELDLVSRQEFDVQAALLARTQANLTAMEARLKEIEAKLTPQ